jgi:hypothetical protein
MQKGWNLMLYVYRRPTSTGARELVNALMDAGVPAKRWSARFPRTPRGIDHVICWGEATPGFSHFNDGEMPHVLNGAPLKSKFEQAQILSQAGIPTVEVSRTRPAQVELPAQDPARPIFNRITQQLEEFIEAELSRLAPYREALSALTVDFNRLNEALAIPVPVVQPIEWLARKNNHVGGDDLLGGGSTTPDYWSKKEDIVEEYRIHCFCGKSIRAGKKAPREGFQTPHPWIRSFDGGWRIVYDSYESSREQRDFASRACTALGLEFGAVDLGRRRDNSFVVLEVNRAPGLEGGTVNAYVQAIQKWLRGEITE